MKHYHAIICVMLGAFAFSAVAEDPLPKTLMTQRGKLLVSEEFAKPIEPVKHSGFASGYSGWRFNVSTKGGRWDVVDGTLKGVEIAESNHPATACYGLVFKDVVIQCELRLHNVPLDGRKNRYMQIRTTNVKDYVATTVISPTGLRSQADDDNPATGRTKPVAFGSVAVPVQLGEWQTVLVEIKGNEMVSTLGGKSVIGEHPRIGNEKHCIMFVAGVEGGVRHFRVWEALPNPDWPKNKAQISKGK
ncbi:MAG: family 16 glycoside hydrolase [Verrucomicrobiia bacterium]